jgi:hypothetical protein
MGFGKRALAGVLAAGLLVATGAVQAALSVQPNGTVYDSVQDISWDQDGNAVKTLCDANDPIWQTFDPKAVTDNSGRTKAKICADDGGLNWFEAEAWVAHLNAQAYKGLTNWRQWAVTQPDSSCSLQTTDTPPQAFGYRCTGSEIGHLFKVAPPDGLGNPNQLDDSCVPNCLTNTGPFANFRQFEYWSGTEFAPNPSLAWNSLRSMASRTTTSRTSRTMSGQFAPDKSSPARRARWSRFPRSDLGASACWVSC